MKKVILFLISLALAAALLWWADPRPVWAGVSLYSPWALAVLCSLQLATIAMITWQWQLLARQAGCPLGYWTMASIVMACSFTEAVTPAFKAGGEVHSLNYLPIPARLVTLLATKSLGKLPGGDTNEHPAVF